MTTTKMKVPLSACRLAGADAVRFDLLAADPAKPEIKREWSMVANTGKIMQRWWGGLVLDLDGAAFSQRLALLMDHDIVQRLGYSTTVERTSRGIEAKGRLLSNDLATQVLKESSEGFPFQASLMAVPTRVQELDIGEEATVNGKTVQGPLTIFREWTMRELTLTVLGADGDTATEAFADEGVGHIEVEKMTTETKPGTPADQTAPLASQAQPQAPAPKPNPEALAAERAAGAATATTAERARVLEILGACDRGQIDVARQAIESGVSPKEALSMFLADTRTKLQPPASQPVALGNTSGAAAPVESMPEGEAKWKAEFAASEALRTEFLNDEKIYLAFKAREKRARQ